MVVCNLSEKKTDFIGIKTKLIVLMLLFSTFFVIATIIISFYYSFKKAESDTILFNNNILNYAGQYADKKLQNINSSLMSFYIDSNLRDIMKNSKTQDIFANSSNLEYINSKLYNVFYTSDMLNGIAFFILDNRQLFYFYGLRLLNIQVKSDAMVDFLMNSNTESIILSQNEFDFHSLGIKNDSNLNDYFYIKKNLKITTDGKDSGCVIMQLKWNIFEEIMQQLSAEEAGFTFIADTRGNVLYNYSNNSNAKEFAQLFTHKKIGKTEHFKINNSYVFYTKLNLGEACLVKVIPVSHITAGAMPFFTGALLVGIFMILIIVSITAYSGFKITKPIIELSQKVRYVDESLYFKIDRYNNDEIGILQRSIEQLVSKIKELILKDYKNTVEKRNAQIKALNAQINPHFLHNTLQIIGGIALEKNASEIYTIISVLGSMMRYTLGKYENVCLSEEIKHIKNYFFIQNYRFINKFEVSYDIDDKLYNCLIPKLTLQPIVENCFKHGFIDVKGKWFIKISVIFKCKSIVISISDNGAGIDEIRLEQIKKEIFSKENILDTTGSFALNNIHSRLLLEYGDGYGLSILSKKGQGTTVIVNCADIRDNSCIFESE